MDNIDEKYHIPMLIEVDNLNNPLSVDEMEFWY